MDLLQSYNRCSNVQSDHPAVLAREVTAITPFKVTDFSTTNRKLICDFLLVIISNLPPILHRFRDIALERSTISLPLFDLTPDGGVPLGRSP